jgi:trehalose/maltose transport system permease protein
MESKLFNLSLTLKVIVGISIMLWTFIALFPLLWVLIMSIKLPVDSFAANPLNVIIGPNTLKQVGGLSFINLMFLCLSIYIYFKFFKSRENYFLKINNLTNNKLISFLLLILIFIALFLALFLFLNTHIANFLNNFFEYVPFLKILSKPLIGFTTKHFIAVWAENEFYKQFLNTAFVTLGVVTISLTVGTLAGYALSRSNTMIAFWLLVAALVFRALPHSVLVTGYLELFIDYGLYGKKIAVIILLVAINQPFTIWMLRSFFMNIPQDLDDAAQIDGCNPFQAFWMIIMPLMWPGVITTGLFSFLLAYNDYLVCALLLDGQSQTMVPAIMQYFNMETTMTDLVESIAAAASITLPLFILVMFFQKQIVSGLTQGSVKG